MTTRTDERKRPEPGDWVSYHKPGEGVHRAKVTWAGDLTVQLTAQDGSLDWCYRSQVVEVEEER